MRELDWYDKRFLKRLFRKRQINSDGCWIWTGYVDKDGYGEIWYADETWRVNRIVFLIFKPDEWDSELQINHNCNNPRCFNPEHLYCGTQADNMADRHHPRRKCENK